MARFNTAFAHPSCSSFSLDTQLAYHSPPLASYSNVNFSDSALLTTSFKLNPSLTQHTHPSSLLLYLLDPEQCLIQKIITTLNEWMSSISLCVNWFSAAIQHFEMHLGLGGRASSFSNISHFIKLLSAGQPDMKLMGPLKIKRRANFQWKCTKSVAPFASCPQLLQKPEQVRVSGIQSLSV